MIKKNILKAVLVIGIAFLFQPAAFAQTSHFEDPNGNNVTGDTIDFWVPIGGSHQSDFDQVNASADQVTYKVQKTNTVVTPTCTTWFCVYCNGDIANQQSQCYSFNITMSDPFITDSGAFNMLLCDFAAGTSPGITIVKYKFFNTTDANDTAVLWIRYNVTPTGIAESHNAMLGAPYPNPATNSFTAAYSFTDDNGGNVTVTDLSGKTVYSQYCAAQSGTLTIETSSWAKGVYMLSLTGENGIAARRKIVVE
jgi:hypothetical protein